MRLLKKITYRFVTRESKIYDFLTEDTQIQIAKEEALKSAISLCVIQQDVIRNLIVSLAEMDIGVGVDEELSMEIERLVNSLHASYDLAGEIVGFGEVSKKESE